MEMKHTCHWPGCPIEIPPNLWGCAVHWHALPSSIRIRIRQHYRPGQEIDKRPSRPYLVAVLEASLWIKRHGNWVPIDQELPDPTIYSYVLKDGEAQRLVKVRTEDRDVNVPYHGLGLFGWGDNAAIQAFSRTVTHWQRNLQWENSKP